jgi:hypothetical protein
MNDLMLGIRAILNVGASADVKGICLIDPFDPNRIPVLLLHGLMSSPLVWGNVATAAMEDPGIRRNYQFWYAFYSTGMPVAQSAAHSRQDCIHPPLGRSGGQITGIEEHDGGWLQHGRNHSPNSCHRHG